MSVYKDFVVPNISRGSGTVNIVGHELTMCVQKAICLWIDRRDVSGIFVLRSFLRATRSLEVAPLMFLSRTGGTLRDLLVRSCGARARTIESAAKMADICGTPCSNGDRRCRCWANLR